MPSFFDGPLPTRTIEAVHAGQQITIELPIHGAILAGEARHVAPHRYQNSFNAEAGSLAQALLSDGFTPEQADSTAARILSLRMHIPVRLEDAEHRAMIRHAALVADAESRLRESFEEQQIRKATAVIRFRVKGQRHWSDDDTEARIPSPIRDALAAFYDEEQIGDAPQRSPEEIVEELTATLGKLAPSENSGAPPAEPTTVEVTPIASTGRASSGEPEPSGPQTQPSLPSASPTPRSRTSSRRSSKAKTTG